AHRHLLRAMTLYAYAEPLDIGPVVRSYLPLPGSEMRDSLRDHAKVMRDEDPTGAIEFVTACVCARCAEQLLFNPEVQKSLEDPAARLRFEREITRLLLRHLTTSDVQPGG